MPPLPNPGDLRPARTLEHLADLAPAYDGFLIDQWGVLHDGQQAYPGALDCLRALKAAGKIVIIASNSGKRAEANARRMARLGFDVGAYDDLVTSGEVAWHVLTEPRAPAYWALGHRCLVLAGDEGASLLDGLPIEVVTEPEQAQFVLLASIGEHEGISRYAGVLNRALARGLPLMCTNPDRVRLSRDGTVPAVGALAHEYEKMGGTVRFIGKPHPEIYDYARLRFARHGASRVLAIGDSLQHDVRGGQEAGLDTLFIRDGIFRERFAALPTEQHATLLASLAQRYDASPDWVMPLLRW